MYNFSNFVAELEEIISTSVSYKQIVDKGSNSMRKLLANNLLITDQHIEDIYDGKLDQTVYKSDKNGFIVQIFPWEQGSQTPIHDHDTWGIMGIYKNSLKVAEYYLERSEESVNLIDTQTFIAKQGDVCYLLPPDEEIHQISNHTNQPSISIHVYGKTIDEYNIYDTENNQIIHQIV